jgi:hypothetical protein
MFFGEKDHIKDNSLKCKVNTLACYMSFGPFLCVIHDKMDHSKTILPRLQVKNKMVFGLG